jgi:hypothetical protein
MEEQVAVIGKELSLDQVNGESAKRRHMEELIKQFSSNIDALDFNLSRVERN